MYAAIFAEKEVYECQLKRIMKRVSSLATLYNKKSKGWLFGVLTRCFFVYISLHNSGQCFK